MLDELPRLEAELRWRERQQEAARIRELEQLETETARRESERLAAMGRRRLTEFIRAAWPIVEPGRPLLWGWHLDAMAEHLEAVTLGQIKNLVVTTPPGCTKSRMFGVFWPAWEWIEKPETRWLFFANADDLATRESMSCRRLIESDWYELHYQRPRPAFRITTDQNTKTWYENDRAGHRQAMSILASVTGKKGDRLVVDDPNDAEKVESEANRNAVNRRWDNAIYDRVIDFKLSSRVIVAQRTHQQDLIGHIKETGEFEELCIPEEFDKARSRISSIGWLDPRKDDGEWLRPDQFGPEQKKAALTRLGSAGYAAKHNQNPKSKEGYRFKAEWLKKRWRFDSSSPDWIVLEDERGPYRFMWTAEFTFATADPAASAKTSADPSVICVWMNSPRGDLLWWDCVRRQLEIPDQPKMLEEMYEKHNFRSIGIEAVASNRAMFQFAQRLKLPALELSPKGLDKLAHASGALILVEAGTLWLPDPSAIPGFPLDTVIDELVQFQGTPADQHDDIVDTLSYAVDMRPKVSTIGGGGRAPTAHAPRRGPLFARR